MPARIRNQLAQQIVDTLKTICSHDINFIDVQGRISASTDPARVGEYHFGGHNAAQSGQVIVIGQDDTLNSMRQGINMPIRFHGSTVAVIGITGEPVNPEFVSEVLERNGLSDKAEQWRAMVIQLKESHVHTLSAIEAAAQNVTKRLGSCLYAYRFPDEYVLIVKERDSARWEKALRALAADWPEDIRAGIGSARRLSRQDLSFQAAKLALQSLETGENFASYESIRLEILLGSVSEHAAKTYMEKCLKGLDQGDKDLLNLYFACEMSLKQTADRGFQHVNTVQYHLRRIRDRCGLDPRRFRDASLLYTALRIDAMNK